MAKELTAEQMKAIDNYGSQIKTLKDFVTAVRTRPGMYIGPLGNGGLMNMCRECWQNSLDIIIDPAIPGDWISFFYDERSREVIVEDNGIGIPHDDIIRILTTQHTSKNYDKQLYQYSSGQNGIGLKASNALSAIMIVESYKYDGTAVRVECHKGYPTKDSPKKIPNKSKKQGTKIYFVPDEEILGDMNLPWKKLYNLFKRIISITPIGTSMDFKAIDIDGKEFTEHIINKDGIVADLIMKVQKPIIKPIVIGDDDGMHKLDIALCYDAGDDTTGPSDEESVTSFSNYCPTVSGTHVDGSLEGICRWFTLYMNNIYLASQKTKDKIKVNSNDIKTGLNVFIAAAHLHSNFIGQSKDILSNEDMIPFCKDTVMKGLDEWSKANPQDLQKLAKFFKDIAELRIKQESGKAKIVTKYQKNPITNLPRKYVRPTNDKVKPEVFIVEGDSALGKAQEDRLADYQALFPIRGKIINAFKASKQSFFNNEEVQGITRIIFGQDYHKGLTIDDCKVDKIIFMADADVDGAHISALLERMFVMYYPFLIAAGKVYKAVPPLFSITEGKKRKYFTENIDLVKYVQKTFLDKNEILDIKKNTIAPKDLTKFFLTNSDYIYYLERVANTYAVDPYLLEIVLYHYISNKRSIKFDKLRKEVKSAYRFIDVYNEKGTIVVRGTIEKSNLIIISDKFLNDCYYILDLIEKNADLYYNLNGKKASIYSVMKVYESTRPSSVQRYKGLGEMGDDGALGESTMYPENRTLIQYTLDDARESIQFIREYESDTKKILSEVGVVTRDDLLD